MHLPLTFSHLQTSARAALGNFAPRSWQKKNKFNGGYAIFLSISWPLSKLVQNSEFNYHDSLRDF